jgi:hypothetical protein
VGVGITARDRYSDRCGIGASLSRYHNGRDYRSPWKTLEQRNKRGVVVAICDPDRGGCASDEDLAYGEAEQLDARGSRTMPKSRDNATVEFAMTLSTLAYVDENRTATQQQTINEINAGLEQAGYEGWQVVWGPALNVDRSNLAYAAGNGQTGQLAISIRGSDFSFWLNWIEDLAAVRQVPYNQFVSSASGQIAFGTAIGLRQVLGMRDGTTSLETFLTAAPEGTPVLITGHSLGGCLASALAPCAANWMSRAASISVYTIAAPSPGNADFADYYNALFTDQSGHSGIPFLQQPGRGAECLGKPRYHRDILSTAGVLPSRYQQDRRPRRKRRSWEIRSARRYCGG